MAGALWYVATVYRRSLSAETIRCLSAMVEWQKWEPRGMQDWMLLCYLQHRLGQPHEAAGSQFRKEFWDVSGSTVLFFGWGREEETVSL
ncbi:hypothetical protein F5Y09DRAFT_324529 [Xylaria sp. FL1042]|nr:hypothetical protein F5Y09DRAFT_324529 [Xylaria sp. FL1042]